MSFLPVFATWDVVEEVGHGGYGRVYKCARKKPLVPPAGAAAGADGAADSAAAAAAAQQQQQLQMSTQKKPNEDSLSADWHPSLVALKMILYVRESTKQRQIQFQQQLLAAGGGGAAGSGAVVAAGEIPAWFQGAPPDLLNGGLEGIKEAAALQAAGPHPCLIRLHSCFFSLRYKALCIVEEWANGPTLGDIYSTCGALSEAMMTPVTIDLLQGLLQLHACRMIHRDVKPTNIILTRGGVAKIADLGVCAFVPDAGEYRNTYVGTAGFMAPEVIARSAANEIAASAGVVAPNVAAAAAVAQQQRGGGGGFGPMSARNGMSANAPGEGYNESSDMWSLGVSLLEGAMGQVQAHDYAAKVARFFSVEAEAEARRLQMLRPPQELPYDEAFAQQRSLCENRLLQSFHLSKDFADVLLQMLDPIPTRRASALKLLTKHPFCLRALETISAAAPPTTTAAAENPSATTAAPAPEASGDGSAAAAAVSTPISAAAPPPPPPLASSADSAEVSAVVRAYVRNYNKNPKAYRGAICEAIARIPQQRKQERNLLNPSNLLLPEATAANDDGCDVVTMASAAAGPRGLPGAVDSAARKNKLYTDAFRAPPPSSSWTLPADKFIDVVCALDFPTTSGVAAAPTTGAARSSGGFMIGSDPATASIFNPVSSADVNVIRVGAASKEDLARAARRVEVGGGGGSNAASMLLQPALPFGPLFQTVLMPSLDAASMRSARLDTWIEDAVSLSGTAGNGAGGGMTLAGLRSSDDALDSVAAFDNLRSIFSECEAAVPNFSESFLSAVTDMSVVDPAACALVTHAFDRGTWVTRHRDGMLHGMALRAAAPQPQSVAAGRAGAQPQQQGPRRGSTVGRMSTPRMPTSASMADFQQATNDAAESGKQQSNEAGGGTAATGSAASAGVKGNVFNPVNGNAAFMFSSAPSKIAEDSVVAVNALSAYSPSAASAASNSNSVLVPRALLEAIRNVATAGKAAGAAGGSGDGNGLSLQFRDQWLSSGRSGGGVGGGSAAGGAAKGGSGGNNKAGGSASAAAATRREQEQMEADALADALISQPGMPRITNPAALPSAVVASEDTVARGSGGARGAGGAAAVGVAGGVATMVKRQQEQQQHQLELQQRLLRGLEAADALVANGVETDGDTIYAADLFLRHEQREYNAQLMSTLNGRWI